MSEHIESGGWWARTLRPTPRKRLGAAAVALALVAVTAGVWLSPSVAVTATSTATAKEIRLAAENEKLRNSLEARENEVESLERSQAKAAAERKAAAESGKAKAAAEQAAAEADGAQKAEAARAAADARSQAKAAAEKAAADAKGKAKSAAVRAEQAEADAARARARAAAANAPKAPSEPAPAVKPYAPSLDSIITTRDRLFGLFTPQAPFSWAETDSVAARIGAQPTATGYFQGWDAPFRADAVTRSWQKGTLPMLTWESRPMLAGNDEAEDPAYALPAIIGGAYDDYLRQYARDVAALGLPIAIRLDHEMNGSWYPWAEKNLAGTSNNGNRPGDFVAMWRHVHDIFEAEGANAHVLWVWSPNIVNTMPAWQKDGTYLSSLYPGDEYVDWVGLSGYYRPPFKEDQTPTFSYTYDRSLNQLRSITSKPIYLAEIGASETGGNKAAWVADLFTALAKPENADIRGFAWFNHAVTTISNGQRITNDWRIESREDSLAAFVAGLNNPSAGFTPTTTLTSLEP
jgi:hypothetical protein